MSPVAGQKSLPHWWSTDIRAVEGDLHAALSARFSGAALESIRAAAKMAAQGHANQKRANDVPYVIHPYRVAISLMREYGQTDPELLQAALLHDLVEDSLVTIPEIAQSVGFRAAGIVQPLTRREKRPAKGDHIDDAYIQGIVAAGPAPILVKLADKIDNVRDALNHPDVDKRSLYVREAYQVFLPLIQHLEPQGLQEAITDRMMECLGNHPTFDAREPARYFHGELRATFDALPSGKRLRHRDVASRFHRFDQMLERFLLFNPDLPYWLTSDGVEIAKVERQPVELAINVAEAFISRIEKGRIASLIALAGLPAFFADPRRAGLWRRVEDELHRMIALLGLRPSWLGSILDERRHLLLAVHARLFLPASWSFPPWLNFARELLSGAREGYLDVMAPADADAATRQLELLLLNPDALRRAHTGSGSTERVHEVVRAARELAPERIAGPLAARLLFEGGGIPAQHADPTLETIYDALIRHGGFPRPDPFRPGCTATWLRDDIDLAGLEEVRELCGGNKTALSGLDRLTRLLAAQPGTTWMAYNVAEIAKRWPLFVTALERIDQRTGKEDLPSLGIYVRTDDFDEEHVLTAEPAPMLALRNRLPEASELELRRFAEVGISAVSIFDVLVWAKIASGVDGSAEPLWMPRVYRVLDTMADLDPLNVQTITIAFEAGTDRRFTAHLPIPASSVDAHKQLERKRILFAYLAATIVNHAMILGSAEASVECSAIPEDRAALGCSSDEVAAELRHLLARPGYTVAVKFVENFRTTVLRPDAMPRNSDEMPFTREDMTYGTMLGIDIGGTDVKACAFHHGEGSQLAKLTTFEKPETEVDATDFVDRILKGIDSQLHERPPWPDLDGVGISWPGAVRGGRVTGFSNTLRWLRFPERKEAFTDSTPARELLSVDLAGLFAERIRVKYRTTKAFAAVIENDGNAEAYGNFCLREMQSQARPGAKIVLKLGTSLAGGHITAQGAVSPYLAESSKAMLDFRMVALGQPESSVAREYVSSKGVRNLSRTLRFRGKPLFGVLDGANDEKEGKRRIESLEIGRLLSLWRAVDPDESEANPLLAELAAQQYRDAGSRAVEVQREIAARARRGGWDALRECIVELGRDYRDRKEPDPELVAQSDWMIGQSRLGVLLGTPVDTSEAHVRLDGELPELLAEKVIGSVALFSQLAVHVAHMIVLLYNVYRSARLKEVILAGGPLSGVSGQVVQRQAARFLLQHYDKLFGPGKSLEPGTIGLVDVIPGAGAPVPDRNSLGPLGAAMIASRVHKAAGLAELRKAIDLRLTELRAGQTTSAKEMLAAVRDRLPRVTEADVTERLEGLAAEGLLMPRGSGVFVKAGP